ncbi:mucin-2-like [Diplodia corticola]|uniref:Mucin-2-like n=1 Tax=Diplodia corticola TaxID=236234 RepID=A0A1J9QQX8_9PEZI|nr:mucin-2-like [Diplodia corticola]OJD30833.1 mucin-2-like [Diplodia corticola]
MANPFSWTPSRNQDMSFEDGLALIDAFYEGPDRDAVPGTTMPPPTSPPVADSAQTVGRDQVTDDARTAIAIAQLPDSPIDRHNTNKRAILPSSPPEQDHPQWQPHWTIGLPPSFTSPPNVTIAPPPSPATGLVPTIQSASFPVASHIKSSASPQLSRVTPPNTFAREDDSPTVTTSKAGSSSLATSKNTSPDLSTPKIDSPILTATPISINAPAFRKTPIPLPTSFTVTKPQTPILSAAARTSSVAKENKPPSSKALKKKATDSPNSASTASRSVKKQRCVRCVKQHGACDLDTKHPCTRCAKANVAPEECVPRDYTAKRRPSQPVVGTKAVQGTE